MDDEFILTERGKRKLDSLRDRLHDQIIPNWEVEDYLVLNSVHLGAIPVTGPGSEFAPILRRLFEGGYIDYA